MYCTKCGTENTIRSVYCKKCGFLLEDEEETRLATESESEEAEIFSIRPTLIFVKAGYVIAVIAGFLLVVILNVIGNAVGVRVPYVISIPAGLAFLLIPAYFHLRQKTRLYTLKESKFQLDHGLLSKTTRNVPLGIIQDVTVSTSMSQRLLGFGNVEIENANESDGRIILRNIDSPKEHAEMVLKQMSRRHRKG